MKQNLLPAIVALSLCVSAAAQVNSGSNGSDGAFNPTTNTVINMADHPDGIYQYTSVNISNGLTVTFIPNANNTPVVWLVQSNCVISGMVSVSGQSATEASGGSAGPGGWSGGNGGSIPSGGYGPGGGSAGGYAFSASYGSLAVPYGGGSTNGLGSVYGNNFIVPLLGGSGGGGTLFYGGSGAAGGGGGGGALLIAANGEIKLNGSLQAAGGSGLYIYFGGIAGGAGSGGAVRLVAGKISGTGGIAANGGCAGNGCGGRGGAGRIRFDAFENAFAGQIDGAFTAGFQPIIITTNGQAAQLTVASVAGVPVSASPSGQLATPDAVLSAQQNNPIPIVVHCSNIPLNTQITVSVKPATGATVSATGLNNTGTISSSTATVLINMPRGGGLIYATAAN